VYRILNIQRVYSQIQLRGFSNKTVEACERKFDIKAHFNPFMKRHGVHAPSSASFSTDMLSYVC